MHARMHTHTHTHTRTQLWLVNIQNTNPLKTPLLGTDFGTPTLLVAFRSVSACVIFRTRQVESSENPGNWSRRFSISMLCARLKLFPRSKTTRNKNEVGTHAQWKRRLCSSSRSSGVGVGSSGGGSSSSSSSSNNDNDNNNNNNRA